MRRHLAFIAVLLVMAFALDSGAAPAPIQVKPGSIAKGSKKAFFAGGESTTDLSLIDAAMATTADGVEALTLFYGNERGQRLKGLPGYFQISLDRDGKRVTIDLAQVARTAVDPEILRKKLKDSRLVSTFDMTMDPSDSTTNVTLIFKSPVEIGVEASNESSPSRVTISMKPTVTGGKK